MIRILPFFAALLLACFTLVGTASAQSADDILARFDNEPTVLEVQTAAMIYAGVDPESIEGWTGRADMANLMPDRVEYRLRYQDNTRETDRYTDDLNPDGTLLGSETRREERDTGDLRHEVYVRWDLSKAIFNPDVLRAAREIGRQTKLREDILTTVTKLYYERRRAQIDMILKPPTDASDRIRKELRIQELTADIDALTGSWFSGELKRAGQNPY